MKERPILFSAPMVRAILDGTKTQTRRVAKLTCAGHVKEPGGHRRWHTGDVNARLACPYGQPGDRLWVRETWVHIDDTDDKVDGMGSQTYYRASAYSPEKDDEWLRKHGMKWKPSIHMPRWASRITLEITGVRVERLKAISEVDALAEGIVRLPDDGFGLPAGEHYHAADPRQSYLSLWEAINGADSVEANPLVWVVEFNAVKGGV